MLNSLREYTRIYIYDKKLCQMVDDYNPINIDKNWIY